MHTYIYVCVIILYNHILSHILFYIIVFQHILVFSGFLWFVSGRCANQNQKLCIPGQERKVWYFRLPYHSEGNAGSICHFVACCLCVPASFPIGCHVMSRPISTICTPMCLHLMSRDFTIIHGFVFLLSELTTWPKQCQNNPKTQTRRQTTLRRKEPRLWWRWDNRSHAMSRHWLHGAMREPRSSKQVKVSHLAKPPCCTTCGGPELATANE